MTKKENNKINDSIVDDEFDRLLDEFIRNNAKETEESKMMETSFDYKGQTYQSPEGVSEAVCILRDFEIGTGCSKLQAGKNDGCLYITHRGGSTLHITIGSDQWEKPYDKESVVIPAALYRAGTPTPLATSEMGLTDSKPEPMVLNTEYPLEPGNYFVYFGNAIPGDRNTELEKAGEGICRPIKILTDGSRIKRPRLKSCESVEWANKAENGLWKNNSIKFSLVLEDFVETYYMLGILFYNSDLALVAQGTALESPARRNRRKIRFNLEPEKAILPGNYTAVLTANRFPFALMTITIDNRGGIYCRTDALDKEDYFFKTVREMEFGRRPLWHITRNLPGLRDQKRKLYALYEERCRAERAGYRLPGEVLVFTAPTDFRATRTAYSVKMELSIGKKSINIINCEGSRENFDSRINLLLEDREDTAFILYHADKLSSPENQDMLNAVLESVAHPEEGTLLVLCFNDNAFEPFIKQYPQVVESVNDNRHIRVMKQSVAECVDALLKAVEKSDMLFNEAIRKEIVHTVVDNWKICNLQDWDNYDDWLEETVKPALCERLNIRVYTESQPQEVTVEDLRLENHWEILSDRKAASAGSMEEEKVRFEDAMKELNGMVGLNELKKGLADLFIKMQFNKQRERLGLPADSEAPHHMLFTGNPGTGKTTVAKLIGKIYRSMGLLSDGEVIVTERTQLVGPYIGMTEEKMREMLENSKGKVLFIDEAYTLCDSLQDRKDFGNRVIESLLTVLAEPHPDLVVILAGYEDEMQRLLKMNQGLKSRFVCHYEFEDYTAEELFLIAINHLARYKYVLTEEARDAFVKEIAETIRCKGKDFGNARWVKQVLDNTVLPAMARRVMQSGKPLDMELCTRIEVEDIHAVKEQTLFKKKKDNRIGFMR